MDQINTSIKDLAVIGDRRTCAYVDKEGSFVWYCPGRFDKPSVFGSLLDAEKGGAWYIIADGLTATTRTYLGDSAILKTELQHESGALHVEDWMPMGTKFTGVCRRLSKAPTPLKIILSPKPDYGRGKPELKLRQGQLSINDAHFLYASHPVLINGESVICEVPQGEECWFVLADQPVEMDEVLLQESWKSTQKEWEKVSSHITYHGAYEKEVQNSLRVLRMMTFAENGGIIAAGTTSLPEVAGGTRNYDYRYVWLRDAAMIASALTRAGSDGQEERKFLDFICAAMHNTREPVVPFFTLDFKPAPGELELEDFAGYANSKPVRVGNNANGQLQLDAISNVLLAAKVIYNHFDTREHWGLISQLADYLVEHWHEKDHGIWEETQKQHYTVSKVVASVSLKHIAEQSEQEEQRERWLKASADIRKFVEQNCLTSEGAYAAYPGAEAVDVSAILFPIWAYTDAGAPTVLKTIEVLERDYCQNNLFRRHLVEYSGREGAFLAGTFWVAQYYVMRKDWQRFEQIMEAALAFMNDVGLMPEEGDPVSGEYLGNIPQTFVHASLVGAVIDYENARD